jgi:hypothetical protein
MDMGKGLKINQITNEYAANKKAPQQSLFRDYWFVPIAARKWDSLLVQLSTIAVKL